jgi:putative acetyltransferase
MTRPTTPATSATSIRAVRPEDRAGLPAIWLRSVRATHTFLREAEIQLLMPFVVDELTTESDLELWILADRGDRPVGFMGLIGPSLEALFLDPSARRRGDGRRLVEHAMALKGPLSVEVNEENSDAVRFYETMGFETFERSPDDGAGRPYPILRMHQPAV